MNETVIRCVTRDRYYIANRDPVEDSSLSYKAKGILTYCLSRPPNWKITMSDLVDRSTDGRDAVQSGVKELCQFGYACYFALQDSGSRLLGRQLFVRESLSLDWPTEIEMDGDSWRVLPEKRVFRRSGFPTVGKPAPNNNETTNNNETLSTRTRTREEVLEAARWASVPVDMAEKFFLYYESRGWPEIKDLRSALTFWKANERSTVLPKKKSAKGRQPGRNYDKDTRG